ncbi:NAD(P)-binding protein [Hypoxylon cercidicola]|nr:NAD(P)-binding protein [Hypoxylon cercidicola]
MVKVLVLGATGKQGGATATALLSSSSQHAVRAYVRDVSSEKARALAAAGAELVKGGDWDRDVASLDRALAGGIEAVFFPSTPSFADPEAEVRGATNIVEAAKRAGTVTHVLYSTVGGVPRFRALPGWDSSPFFANYWTSKAKGEELVRTAGFAHYTILRPKEFMSNYAVAEPGNSPLRELARDGVLRTAHPADAPLSFVDVADVGRVAAAAIEAPGTFAGGKPTRELDVVAERLTPSELVARLGEVAGKTLRVHTYAPGEAAELAKTNPVVAGQITRKANEEHMVPDDFGLGFTTFRDYLAKHRDAVVELYKNAP